MVTKMLKIYSPKSSPRLEYVSEVIFNNILGIDFEISGDRRKIGNNPSIIYSDEKITGHLIIKPAGLIFSEGIEAIAPVVTHIGEMPVLFGTEDGTLPFDIFSAAFFMLSRYEEYLPFTPDSHGRFIGSRSFAFREGFLQLPVVDIWARYLANVLVKKYPVLAIRHNEYKALLTVDVDQPYAFRSRGFLRSVGGFVKGITGSGPSANERMNTVMGKEEDPYDTFAYINQMIDRYGSEALFFFPVGDHGEYDRNPSFRDHAYSEIITTYNKKYGTGLHPSYHSAGRPKVLITETERYRHITGHLPEKARQHWLLLKMPETYRAFQAAGIRFDYTMGYADEPGFRAGIARPYRFYDIENEDITNLTIVPFQFMDGTLRQYRNMTPDAAIESINRLNEATRKVGGLFVSIWHNTSLAEIEGWEGWRKVFEATLAGQKE